MIEGNRLTQEQVAGVIEKRQHFPWSDAHEGEGPRLLRSGLGRGGTPGQRRRTRFLKRGCGQLHAPVLAGGKTRVKPTSYRAGQNVIRDARSSAIVYMPPEAKGCYLAS